MADIGTLLDRPRGMGVGGSKIKSAVTVTEDTARGQPAGIKQVILDIAEDLDAINTEGAFGLTLRLTKDRLNATDPVGPAERRDSDWGQGASGLGGAGDPDTLPNLLRDIAADLVDIEAAGNPFAIVHTAAKIPFDFMHGGSAMHRNPASDDGGVPAPGVGPDGVYDWIVQPLNAIATDIAAAKAANTLTFTPKTIPA